ncbi:hypothetical protein [Flavobacterium sp.]|jgi:hypothetical protein|uniref:hypothetical protein n=1 Tax=Flavobacterium sp. TaxID=239 RepID=UPI0037BF1E42
MKKRLEADLISIAHRVLKLKNKSEVDQLYLETRKLYEALTVLKFYGDNYEQVKAEISEEDIAEKLVVALEEKEVAAEILTELSDSEQKKQLKAEKKSKKVVDEPIEESIAEEKIEAEIEIPEEEIIPEEDVLTEETMVEEIVSEEEDLTEETTVEEIVSEEKPILEEKEEVVTETIEENTTKEKVANEENVESEKSEIDTKIEPLNELLEMLSTTKEETVAATKPEFEFTFDSKINEKPEDIKIEKNENPSKILFDDFLGTNYSEPVFVKPEELEAEKKAKEETTNLADYVAKTSLNDKISRGLTIGLNDRVAFMKHLFDDNSEDYNRVLSQLITFDSLQEATDFIDNFVKPDYNDWNGKEEYAERFMEIIEKKFS